MPIVCVIQHIWANAFAQIRINLTLCQWLLVHPNIKYLSSFTHLLVDFPLFFMLLFFIHWKWMGARSSQASKQNHKSTIKKNLELYFLYPEMWIFQDLCLNQMASEDFGKWLVWCFIVILGLDSSSLPFSYMVWKMFYIRKNVIQVWNDIRLNKWWQNNFFWLN